MLLLGRSAGDEQEHRGEVFFHVDELNHVLAGHFDICWPWAWFQAFSSLQKTAPSMSEAGTGRMMPAPFPSTAVSLLSTLVETWELTQKLSYVFWSQLPSPLLFLQFSLSQDFSVQLFRKSCSWVSFLLISFVNCTRNLWLQVSILLFSKVTLNAC